MRGGKTRAARKQGAAGPKAGRRVVAPVAAGRKMVSQGAPSSRRVSHRELVGLINVTAGADYQLVGQTALTPGYDLNPGNVVLFPWLSHIAMGFEKYRFTKVRFDMVTGNSTSSPGRIHLGFDYDYDDVPPSTLAAAGAMMGFQSGPIWSDLSLSLDIARLNSGIPTRYVSSGHSLNGLEPRTVYGGFLVVAAVGATAGGTFELYVSYDVELTIPQLPEMELTSLNKTTPDVSFAIAGAKPLRMDGAQTIPVVVPGAAAPTMLHGGTGVPFTSAIDIRGLTGTLSSECRASGWTASPGTTAPGSRLTYSCHDVNGTFLGQVDTPVPQFGVFSAWDPGQWTTMGADTFANGSFSLSTLTTAYPQMVYLCPFIWNAIVKGGEAFIDLVLTTKLRQ